MKKAVLLVFAFSLWSLISLGQGKGCITLAELKTLSKLNQDDFETQVLSRGFGTGLQKEYPNEKCSYYGYNSETAEKNGGYNQVSLTLCKTAKPIAGFSTSNKDCFVSLKTAFIKAGFRYTGNSENGQGLSNFKNYSNGNWRVNTYTFEKGNLVFYCMQVWQQN